MRTTVEISDSLYDEVSKAYKIKSKSVLINMGLEELSKRIKMEEFCKLSGKIKLNLSIKDLEKSRDR